MTPLTEREPAPDAGGDHLPDPTTGEASALVEGGDAVGNNSTQTPQDGPVAEVAEVTQVRRAPRFGSFVFVALALAFLTAFGLSVVRDSLLAPAASRGVGTGGLFLILFVALGCLFVLVACALAVVIDRRSVRRFGAAAPRTSVVPTPATGREHPATGREHPGTGREHPASSDESEDPR